MSANDAIEQFQELAVKVERLVELCRQLSEENRLLRLSQDQLIGERAHLLTRNEQARSRVEAMIHRLKSMEHNA
jgi:cell division protein ZapB